MSGPAQPSVNFTQSENQAAGGSGSCAGPCRSLGTASQVTSPFYSEPGYLGGDRVGWLPGQRKGLWLRHTEHGLGVRMTGPLQALQEPAPCGISCPALLPGL